MKNERGITLVALIITVIVLLLLAGTAISVGETTYKTAQREAFISEMKIIQAKVDEIVVKQDELNEILENNTNTITRRATGNSNYGSFKWRNNEQYVWCKLQIFFKIRIRNRSWIRKNGR